MQVMRLIKIFLLLALGISVSAHVASLGIGQIANNMMEPVSVLANFIGSIAITLGLTFQFAAVFKYMQHRVNPLAVPISTVVILIIMGVLLLALPFAYKISEAGFPLFQS
jgi:hypothetical protein